VVSGSAPADGGRRGGGVCARRVRSAARRDARARGSRAQRRWRRHLRAAAGGRRLLGRHARGQLGIGTSRGPDACNGDPCATTPVSVRDRDRDRDQCRQRPTRAAAGRRSVDSGATTPTASSGSARAAARRPATRAVQCDTLPVRGIAHATRSPSAAPRRARCWPAGGSTAGATTATPARIGTSSGPHSCTAARRGATTPVRCAVSPARPRSPRATITPAAACQPGRRLLGLQLRRGARGRHEQRPHFWHRRPVVQHDGRSR